jgi:hypothetical protein
MISATKNAFLRWLGGCLETFRYTRFPTQLFCFSVALMLILNVAESVYVNAAIIAKMSPQRRLGIVGELSIPLFFAFLLAVRFALLFLKDKKYFRLSQFVWLFTYLTLVSQISAAGCTKNAFPIFGETLSYIFVPYLFFSPVRQIATLLVSFGRITVR